MLLKELLEKIKSLGDSLVFADVIYTIDECYTYTPTKFTNGIGADAVVSEAGVNQGSCKVFAFAQLNQLSEQDTLLCFGEHYRDVLADPAGESHANIRRFMRDGWAGIMFEQQALVVRG